MPNDQPMEAAASERRLLRACVPSDGEYPLSRAAILAASSVLPRPTVLLEQGSCAAAAAATALPAESRACGSGTSLPVLHASIVEQQLGDDMHYIPGAEGDDCTGSLDIANSEELQQVQQLLAAGGGAEAFLQAPYRSMELGSASPPYVDIVHQPQSRGYRFRYKCEGQSHGGLQAEGSGKDAANKRLYPTIAIRNFRGSRARVRVSLVTADDPPRPHAHELIGKHCSDGHFAQEVSAQPNGEYLISFSSLSIQHATRKSIPAVLKDRYIKELHNKQSQNHFMSPLPVMLTEKQISKANKDAEEQAKNMQTNAVRLKFEADMTDHAGTFLYACAVSNVIHDSKSTTANPLKISRIDKQAGTCIGGDEVFLLCSKVQKEDIRVRFYEPPDEVEDDSSQWEDYGKFSATDVHRQYAIVFKTPPYKNQAIQQPVEVYMLLVRPSDNEESEPRRFTYYPHITDQDGIGGKRRKPTAPDWERKYKPGADDRNSGSSSSSGGSSANGSSRNYNSSFTAGGSRSHTSTFSTMALTKQATGCDIGSNEGTQHPGYSAVPFGVQEFYASVGSGGSIVKEEAYAVPLLSVDLGLFPQSQHQPLHHQVHATWHLQQPLEALTPQATNTLMQFLPLQQQKQQQQPQQQQPQQQQQTQHQQSPGQQAVASLLLQQQHDADLDILLAAAGGQSFLPSDQLDTDDGSCEPLLPAAALSPPWYHRALPLSSCDADLLPTVLPLCDDALESATVPPALESRCPSSDCGRDSPRHGAASCRSRERLLDPASDAEEELWPAVYDFPTSPLSSDSDLLAASASDYRRSSGNGGNSIAAVQSYACSGDVRFLVAALHRLTVVRNDAGDNAIHLAVIHNQQEALCNLLSASKMPATELDDLVNQRNDDGQTPLHIAAIIGLPKAASVLLRFGANPCLCDRSGNTAWHLAAREGDAEVLRALGTTRSDAGTVVDGSSGSDCSISKSNAIDSLNYDGLSPLHLAIKNGHLTCVRLLVAAGADVNLIDGKCGQSALHYAVENGRAGIVGYLLTEALAEVNQPRFDGNTALHVACCLGLSAIVELLVAAGADADQENNDASDREECDHSGMSVGPVSKRRRGNTPLDLARDNAEILSALRSGHSSEKGAAIDANRGLLHHESSTADEPHVVPSVPDVPALMMDALDQDLRTELAAELSASPLAWARLANAVGLGSLVAQFRSASSPGSGLLDSYQAQHGTVDELRVQMMKLNLNKAVAILDSCSDGRLDSGVGTSLTQADSHALQSCWGIQSLSSLY